MSHRTLLPGAGTYESLVPHPLPADCGQTEEEEVEGMRRQLQLRRTDLEHNAAVRETPTTIGGKVWVAAEGIMGSTKVAVGGVEVTASEKKFAMDEKSRARLIESRYKISDLDPAECRGCYACAAFLPSQGRSITGHLLVTLSSLRFHSDLGYFVIPLHNVLSIQKAVNLLVEKDTAPYLLPIPHPDVVYNALQIFCTLGAVYNFHSFVASSVMGGVVGTSATVVCKSLEKCFLQSDRIWRERVDVDGLLESRY